jgi:putative ABC transport system permease protein
MRTLFRLALRVCPPSIRHAYGPEMEAVFLHCLQVEERRRSRALWPLFCAYGLFDVLLFALARRREALFGRLPAVEIDRLPRRTVMNVQDLRSAFRLIRQHPLFAAGIIVMLGLGIGASTAIFSVVHGVLLRSLPFPEPDRLVRVWGSLPARNLNNVALTEANFWDLRDRNQSLSNFGAWHGASFTLTGHEEPERVRGATVTAGFFRALAPRPVAGRLFEPGEDDPGAPGDRVLLAHDFWTRRFGADPGIVGQAIALDGRPYLVVGVLPPGAPWLNSADVFVPFVRRRDADRGSWEYVGIGRVKDGLTIEGATADLQRVARELEAEHPSVNRGLGITVGRSTEWIGSPPLRRTLWILLGASGLLLLIACVNVTNLLLAESTGRQRETAVRTALGATRVDLVRQRLTEASVLSGAGAALGWAIAWAMLRVFKALDPGGIPRLPEVGLNGWMLGFTVLVAVLVGLATGLVPALSAPFTAIVTALRTGQRGAIGDRRHDRLRSVFVAAEIALSLVLLVGAGLLVRSLAQVLATERGFETGQRLLATVSLPRAYSAERRTDIATRILNGADALPQTISVAAVSGTPLSPGSTGLGIVAGDRPDIPESTVPWATWRIVTKDYFAAMGLPLLAGRGFTEQDIIEKPWRLIISQRLANLLWPEQSPIGKTAILWKGQGNTPGEVIGVVGNMRERGLEEEPTYAVYFPAYGALGGTTLQLVMHTAGPPEAAVPALRALVRDVDPGLPVSGVRTLDDVVAQSVATRRFTMLLLAVFAGCAAILALAGVYGVLAYTVARRTPEIGVRLALGAAPGQVVGRVFSRGMYPVAAGVVIGLVVTFWLARLMGSLLFDVEPDDVVTYLVATVGLIVTAAVACYWPARRVRLVDPVVALRTE